MPVLSPDDERALRNQLRANGFTKVQSQLVVQIVEQVASTAAASAVAAAGNTGGTAAASPGALFVNALVLRR